MFRRRPISQERRTLMSFLRAVKNPRWDTVANIVDSVDQVLEKPQDGYRFSVARRLPPYESGQTSICECYNKVMVARSYQGKSLKRSLSCWDETDYQYVPGLWLEVPYNLFEVDISSGTFQVSGTYATKIYSHFFPSPLLSAMTQRKSLRQSSADSEGAKRKLTDFHRRLIRTLFSPRAVLWRCDVLELFFLERHPPTACNGVKLCQASVPRRTARLPPSCAIVITAVDVQVRGTPCWAYVVKALSQLIVSDQRMNGRLVGSKTTEAFPLDATDLQFPTRLKKFPTGSPTDAKSKPNIDRHTRRCQ
ncbi:hypothetical protein BC629DRAFT_1439753 [Irpex lacteus]|nr:hypothetical protein BC629DRAFT_1439753 [Irpex lacteus]